MRSNEANGPQASGSQTVTVVLVDDEPLARAAVRRALRKRGVRVVGEAATGAEGVDLATALQPDLVIIDVILLGESAIDSIELISQLADPLRILVLSESREPARVLAAILAGASGYVLKEAGTAAIVSGVRAAAAGNCVISPQIAGSLLALLRGRDDGTSSVGESAAETIRSTLTPRELEIFARLASGESNQQIGRAFSVTENTVRNHVASILSKLELDNRVQAAVRAVRSGLSCFAVAHALRELSGEVDVPGAFVSLLLGA